MMNTNGGCVVNRQQLARYAGVSKRQVDFDIKDGAPNTKDEYLEWRSKKIKPAVLPLAKNISKLTSIPAAKIYWLAIEHKAPVKSCSDFLKWYSANSKFVSTVKNISDAIGVPQGLVRRHVAKSGVTQCVLSVAFFLKENVFKSCWVCGKRFYPKSGYQLTCSTSCSGEFYKISNCIEQFFKRSATIELKADLVAKFKCKICGNRDFPEGQEPLKTFYCSERCKQKAHNKRRSERSRSTKPKDIQFKLAHRLRGRLREMMNGCKKESALNLLGCSIEDFRIHLQSQFTCGMAWNNYGKWEIDHIQPCASFDLTNEYQRKACFHFSNMRPLWKQANREKGDRITIPQLTFPL